MTTTSRANPRKQPRQERARATVEAMIQATARILTEEGESALNTNRIAEVAGVSVGTLYQYFPAKDALVALVMEVELERDRAAFAALIDAAPSMTLAQLLDQGVRANARRFYERAAIHRAILPMVSSVERWELVRGAVVALRADLTALLASRPDELRPEYTQGPDAAQRLDIATLVVFSAMEAVYNEAMCHAPHHLLHPDLSDHLITICHTILLRPT
jgi:AcrR family transcriptional regulator